MPAGRRAGAPYHHGDLRAALVQAGRELLAEGGIAGFSVAQVARRVAVSSAAPYRHFPDREALLAAVVQAAAEQLTEALLAAADASGPDPADRLCAAAGAYSRHVLAHGAGFDLIYLRDLQGERFRDLHAQTRALMDVLIQLALDASPGPTRSDAMQLLSQVMAAAHGYATLVIGDGGPGLEAMSPEQAGQRSVDATRTLIAGHRALHPSPGSGRSSSR
jgi:AcrR family transcriptional regulator